MSRSAAMTIAAALAGAAIMPGAALAEGPGYGGTADALTVQWAQQPGAEHELAVYAVGFRGGSPVRLRVGSAAERSVAADTAGALSLTVAEVAVTGTSVIAMGKTPAGAVRTLVGSVPPPAASTGPADAAPWVAVAALAGGAVAAMVARARRGSRRTGRHRVAV